MAILQQASTPTRFRPETTGTLLLYFSLIVFFISLALYGGLIIINRGQVQAQSDLLSEVGTKEQELRPELLNQIFLLDTRLKNLQTLFSRHLFPHNLFQIIESDTYPSVRFATFEFAADGRRVDMTGSAPNYATLSQQVTAYEQDSRIEHVEFGGLSNTSSNQIGFKVSIVLNPSVLQQAK